MKLKVFAWLLIQDRLNTGDMLVRRRCPIRDVNCVICQAQRETREHLFFECHFNTDCWSALGIAWDRNLGLSSMLALAETVWNKPLYLEVVIICAWNIWKQQNRKYFDGLDVDMQSWLAQFKSDIGILGCRVKPEHKSFLSSFVAGLRV